MELMELILLEWLDTDTVCALLLLEDMVWIGEVPLDTDILEKKYSQHKYSSKYYKYLLCLCFWNLVAIGFAAYVTFGFGFTLLDVEAVRYEDDFELWWWGEEGETDEEWLMEEENLSEDEEIVKISDLASLNMK